MLTYTIVPDGLTAFGVEVSAIDRFTSMRGFATEVEAQAWITEQEKAEARRAQAATGRKLRPFADLILRNREILYEAASVCHRSRQLCSPSLAGASPPHAVNGEDRTEALIRRSRVLLSCPTSTV